MLSMQLNEEEKEYEEALAKKRTTKEKKKISQRIAALKSLLLSLENVTAFESHVTFHNELF